MKLVDVYHTPTLGKTNYYLASLRNGEGEAWPVPGTTEVSVRQSVHSTLYVSSMQFVAALSSNAAGTYIVRTRTYDVFRTPFYCPCFIRSMVWYHVSSLLAFALGHCCGIGVFHRRNGRDSCPEFARATPPRGASSWRCSVCLRRYLTNAPGHCRGHQLFSLHILSSWTHSKGEFNPCTLNTPLLP